MKYIVIRTHNRKDISQVEKAVDTIPEAKELMKKNFKEVFLQYNKESDLEIDFKAEGYDSVPWKINETDAYLNTYSKVEGDDDWWLETKEELYNWQILEVNI